MILDYRKIYILCARIGLTMKEIFAREGVRSQTIKNIKDGRRVNSTTAGKIARSLNCDIIEILKS